MGLADFADVQEEGFITQLLDSSVSSENVLRQGFILEIALAGLHSEKLRFAIRSQSNELEIVIALLTKLSDDEKTRLRYLVRSMSLVTVGVTLLSTVTGSMAYSNYNQFAGPFRRAIVKYDGAMWSEMHRQIRELRPFD